MKQEMDLLPQFYTNLVHSLKVSENSNPTEQPGLLLRKKRAKSNDTDEDEEVKYRVKLHQEIEKPKKKKTSQKAKELASRVSLQSF